MAIPKCPKCDWTIFQATDKIDVMNCLQKITFIHCAKCGCVVSVKEPLNIAYLTAKIAEHLKIPT